MVGDSISDCRLHGQSRRRLRDRRRHRRGDGSADVVLMKSDRSMSSVPSSCRARRCARYASEPGVGGGHLQRGACCWQPASSTRSRSARKWRRSRCRAARRWWPSMRCCSNAQHTGIRRVHAGGVPLSPPSGRSRGVRLNRTHLASRWRPRPRHAITSGRCALAPAWWCSSHRAGLRGAGLPLVQPPGATSARTPQRLAWHVGMLGGVCTFALFVFAPTWGRWWIDTAGRWSRWRGSPRFWSTVRPPALAPNLGTDSMPRLLWSGAAAMPTAAATHRRRQHAGRSQPSLHRAARRRFVPRVLGGALRVRGHSSPVRSWDECQMPSILESPRFDRGRRHRSYCGAGGLAHAPAAPRQRPRRRNDRQRHRFRARLDGPRHALASFAVGTFEVGFTLFGAAERSGCPAARWRRSCSSPAASRCSARSRCCSCRRCGATHRSALGNRHLCPSPRARDFTAVVAGASALWSV